MANPFQLIAVPYHFSIQSEGIPTPKQSEEIKNLGKKLMEELPEAECVKAVREGNFTSCSVPDVLLIMRPYKKFLIYTPFFHRHHGP